MLGADLLSQNAGVEEVQKEIAAGEKARLRWDYQEAIAHYSRALEKDPLNAEVLATRGFMYTRVGDLDRAINDTTRAVQLDPHNARAYFTRAIAYRHRDELDKAIADISEAILLEPDEWNNISQRGDFYAGIDEPEKAMADYDRAIELNPDAAVNFCSRGDLHYSLGDYAAAAKDYLQAQKVEPDDSASYISYAWMLATCYDPKVRNPDKAIEYAKIALDLNPKREDAWPAYAAALASAGKFDEAAEWQQRFADSKVLSESARVEAQSRAAVYKAHQPLIQPVPRHTPTPQEELQAAPAAASPSESEDSEPE